MKKYPLIGVSIIAVVLLVLGTSFPSLAYSDEKKSSPISSGNILYVGGSGPGNYTKIQDAINASSNGDTVFVYDDSSPYYENLIINKSINLVGEDRNTTIINGEGLMVIYVSTDFVNISRFTIYNATEDNCNGIYLEHCSMVSISDCDIHSNGGKGIGLYYSNQNVISHCRIFNNQYHGIFLVNSCWNTIDDCNLSINYGGGVFLWVYSNNNTIKNCLLVNNGYGVKISRWQWDKSNNNSIYHNNFINNYDSNSFDLWSNRWDNGYPSGGNYWSDYNGTDEIIPGIGDTPYDISGGTNQDHYPLMLPYGMTIVTINLVPRTFKFLISIKNVGSTTALNVHNLLTLKGGFLFCARKIGGVTRPLLPGEEMNIALSIFFFGFGHIQITDSIWADNAPIFTEKINGILLLIFFILKH
jgi:parallel beta-helix repeat protein